MLLRRKREFPSPRPFDRASYLLGLSGSCALLGALLTIGVWLTAGSFLSASFPSTEPVSLLEAVIQVLFEDILAPVRMMAIVGWVTFSVGVFFLAMSAICLAFWYFESRTAAKRDLKV